MAKRRMMVQIIPRVIFKFPSTISAERKRSERKGAGGQGAWTFSLSGEYWWSVQQVIKRAIMLISCLVTRHCP